MLDKLSSALKKVTDKIANAIFLDKAVVDSVVKELQRALIEADVNVKLVLEISNKIKQTALDERLQGLDKKEHIIKILHDELIAILGESREIKLQKQITENIIKNNPQIIEEIARDIEKHFTEHFKDTGLKAQIVAPSKYAAILFQNFFEKRGNINTAVVISNEPDKGDEDNTHKIEVVKYLDKIRKNHSSITKYEKDVIESFKHSDGGVEIIIVVDKLLTGFDAPRNTVLYLAKDLHDHGLLQAIARVNRLFENNKLPKTAGYIIDYSENAQNIDTAMKLFSNYDENDVKGTLINVSEKINELEGVNSAEIVDVRRAIG